MRHIFAIYLVIISIGTALQADAPSNVTSEQTQQQTQQESPQFTETEKGYTITFPEKWNWQRNFMGLDVFAPAPAKSDQEGSLANMSVVSGKLDEGTTLDDFFNVNVDNLKKALRDVQVVETGTAAFGDGLQGKRIVYNHAMGDMKLRVVQYFILKNGTGYIITCTATQDEFPKFADLFEKSVHSFKTL